MDWHGVVDSAGDAPRCQLDLYPLTIWHAYCVLMESMFRKRCASRRYDPGDRSRKGIIKIGIGSPGSIPDVEVPQLDPENGGLQLVKPAVPSLFSTEVFFRAPMAAQRPQASRQLLRIGHDHAAVSITA